MPIRTASEVNAAIQSLFRIRAAARPPDAEGNRSVWHQGEKGADLISIVDAGGRILRQEFTLFEDYLLWTSQHGIRTGQLGEEQGSRGYRSSPEVRFDGELHRDQLARAHEALATYSERDAYILHLQQVVARGVLGEQVKDRRTVTTPLLPLASIVPPARPAVSPAPERKRLLLAGAGLLAAAMAALAIAHLLR